MSASTVPRKFYLTADFIPCPPLGRRAGTSESMLASMLVCRCGERVACITERLLVAKLNDVAGRRLAGVPAANTVSKFAFSQGGGLAGLLRRLLDVWWARRKHRRQDFGMRGSPAGIAASLPASMCAATVAMLRAGLASYRQFSLHDDRQ